MFRRRFNFTVATLALIATVATARAADREPRPNVVLLLADDMRPDALGFLGHAVVKTPHLDALAREGMVFTRAITGYPICVVSRAEILTGVPAFRTGVQYRGNRLDPALALWPETMRRAGWHTWFTGKWHNDGHPKQRGFEETRALYTGGGAGAQSPRLDPRGREITGYVGWTFKTDDGHVELEKGAGLTPGIDRHFGDAAVEFIRRRTDKPFFLHVSFTAPHDPRLSPPGYEERYEPTKIPLPKNFLAEHPFEHGNLKGRDEKLLPWPRTVGNVRAELSVYYALISHLDAQVGRIVAALRESGQLERTLIIFTSDHGLALGSHGLTGKQNMYEHTIGVPLVFRGPGVPRGQRSAAQCYLRDLYPTVCELAGVRVPETVQAKGLAPVLAGTTKEIHAHVIGCFTDTQRMIRTDAWKLIHYPQAKRTQLFDLVNDPDELSDVSGVEAFAGIAKNLREKLDASLSEMGDPLAAPR